MDMGTGQVLAEKNADKRWSPASTTKIMTALIALEKAGLNDDMTASDYAINSVGYDYVTAGIKVGETLKFKDLLDLMMITSANEAANIIAENVADDGTIQGFAELMNKKASELGLTGTHFVNPNGTEDENHYSTARDLANLGRAAMKIDAFRSVVGRTDFKLPDTNLRKSTDWKTGHLTFTNQLLKSHSQYYSKVTGIKTGYTDLAGRCLVSSAINPDGLELLAVVLGADSYEILYSESQKLLEYGFRNYSMQELIQKGKYIDRKIVADAVDGKKVEIITNNEVRRILPVDKAELEKDLKVIKTFNEPFAAPISQGQVVGKIEYIYKGKSIGVVDLVAKEAVEKTTFAILRDKYKEIVNDKRFIFGVKAAVILIVVIIILSNILRMINKRKKRNRRYSDSYLRRNRHRYNNYR
jgi:D-alanyl-D-alanine carboxypeptidase